MRDPGVRKLRSVQLSDDEWTIFSKLGGSEWLQARIHKERKVSIVKLVRNQNVLEDSKTLTRKQLAYKYSLSLSTVGVILNETKPNRTRRKKPSAKSEA